MHNIRNMSVNAKTANVLEQLQKNRAEHAEIVKEARAGYMDQAEKALQKRLAQLREGKLVALTFSLNPPQDHTAVYDTVIAMCEAHTDDEMTLDSANFRCLMMDEWDWMEGFLVGSSGYSSLAAQKFSQR